MEFFGKFLEWAPSLWRQSGKSLSETTVPKWTSLQNLLQERAASQNSGRIVIYPLGQTSTPTAKAIDYADLCKEAEKKSHIIRNLDGFGERKPVLLHFDDHWDNILWFWATLFANGLPVMSSPLSNHTENRQKHIQGLSKLLEAPICITREQSLNLFDMSHTMRIHTVESLLKEFDHGMVIPHQTKAGTTQPFLDDIAMLMLTSGSTGNAKAVKITHRQILAAVTGKSSARPLHNKPFLNWIGLDHVAGLVEIHLQSLHLGYDQVHVQAADIVSSPLLFLDLLHRHQVCRTFAPNFFFAKLVTTLKQNHELAKCKGTALPWDLSSLVTLGSGGEPNDTATCLALSEILQRCGAPEDAILPGFGMTETCAGVIYNTDCPIYDACQGHTFASLGKCMVGVEMRVTLPVALQEAQAVLVAAPGVSGFLEVRGEPIFRGYYRNAEATAEVFTQDGWFKTGDTGIIDAVGNLSLKGRSKDVININGVKYNTSDVQAAVEMALGDHAARVVCFPSRREGLHTEQVTVAYVPNQWTMIDLQVAERMVVEACLRCTGARPIILGLKTTDSLPQTTLGKISGAKIRSMFEHGRFDDAVEEYETAVRPHGRASDSRCLEPTNQEEGRLLEDFSEVLAKVPGDESFGPETPVFDIGFTSIELIRLKRRIDSRLGIDVPVITLMMHPTARALARVLEEEIVAKSHRENANHAVAGPDPGSAAYDPIVALRRQGSKTPLWLVHPGVGEVLVFVGLAQQLALDDRPVYALRARGFEPGQSLFGSIAEMVSIYVGAIRVRQPHGPYALAGYSYGAMVAFEMAKELMRQGQEVRFLASFNLPPHIAWRMRQLGWASCLLHLGLFLGLFGESWVESRLNEVERTPSMSRDEALRCVREAADKERWQELGLGEAALEHWADVAHGLHSLAVDYEPTGSVKTLDVFHAVPLKAAAKSREDWVRNHLSKWRDFSDTEPIFHEVGGGHYTMLGPDHVAGFAESLIRAMGHRGV